MSLLIPRRKLLISALSAPYVISPRKATAFLPKGGGGATAPSGDPFAALVATVSPGNWVAAAKVSTQGQAQLAAGGCSTVFPSPLPAFSLQSGSPADDFSDWNSLTIDTKRQRIYAWSSGGDGAYYGNEIYQYDLVAGLWSRAMFPSQVMVWTLPGGVTRNTIVGLNNSTTDPTASQTAPIATSTFGHPYMGNVYLPVLDRFAQMSGNSTDIQASITAGQTLSGGPFLVSPDNFDPVFNGSHKIADGSRYQKVGGLAGSDGLGWNGSFAPGLCPAGNMWVNRGTYEGFQQTVSGGSNGLPGNTNAPVAVACIENGLDVVYYGPSGTGYLSKYVFGGASQYSAGKWVYINDPDAIVVVGGSIFLEFATADHGLNPQCFLVYSGGAGRGSNFGYWDLSPTAQALGGNNAQVTLQWTQLIDRTSGAWAAAQIPIASGGTSMGIGGQQQWDPVKKRFTIWQGGPQIFYVTPPAPPAPLSNNWFLDLAPSPTGTAGVDYPGTSEPNHGNVAGIFGSFRYVPAYGVFIALQNYQNQKIWVYKPSP